MIKEIVKDTEFLSQKSVAFDFNSEADAELIQDMLDTANAHKENCVGLAAIQIGVAKRVILVYMGNRYVPMINPLIVKRSPKTYVTEEGCLSLEGTRQVKRHYSVTVAYRDVNGKSMLTEFRGYAAQVIQHEVDHCNGILI